MTGYIFPC